jgi:hypothetical protein
MPGITFNEDCNHFFFTRGPEKMTREGLCELVDHYAGPQVREMIFNVNAMRIGYAGKVFQSMWDGLDPEAGPDQPFLAHGPLKDQNPRVFQSLLNAKMLHDKGLDPYAVWLDRVREHGKEAWISMRMNDVHFVDHPEGWTVCDFWKQHPEYRRVPYRFETWTDRAYDYGRKEVREYHMALADEILGRYDLDGFELDWMRFGYHFRPGHEAEGRQLLTEFQTRIRDRANRRARQLGHPVKIGVRVPSRPETARGLGMDAVDWARRGLVDMIVVTPLDSVELDIPVEAWKELLAGTDVILGVGIEISLRPHPRMWEYQHAYVTIPAPVALGGAASFLYRGADRVYLFNFQDSIPPDDHWAGYRAVIESAGSLQTAAAGPRRHVVAFSDVFAPGEPQGSLLPAECRRGKTAAFRLHIGPKPISGGARVFVGLGEGGSSDLRDYEVRVNGNLCPAGGFPAPAPVHPIVRELSGFAVPDSALCDGYNVVEVTGTSDEAGRIVWLEIEIKGPPAEP